MCSSMEFDPILGTRVFPTPIPLPKQRPSLGLSLDSCVGVNSLHDDGLPKLRVPLLMLQSINGRLLKVRVVLSIYSTHYDLYAVVSQDCNVIVKDCGYIKLRQCLVSINTAQLTLEITQLKYEGVCMRFQACRRDHLDSIARLLRLSADVENANIFTDIPSPLSASPSASGTDSPLRSFASGLHTQSRSLRNLPIESKLSMPVLAEDEEPEGSDSNMMKDECEMYYDDERLHSI